MAKSPMYSPIRPQTTLDRVLLQKLTTFECVVKQKAESFPLAVLSLSLLARNLRLDADKERH